LLGRLKRRLTANGASVPNWASHVQGSSSGSPGSSLFGRNMQINHIQPSCECSYRRDVGLEGHAKAFPALGLSLLSFGASSTGLSTKTPMKLCRKQPSHVKKGVEHVSRIPKAQRSAISGIGCVLSASSSMPCCLKTRRRTYIP
jgi:hypothetical protein